MMGFCLTVRFNHTFFPDRDEAMLIFGHAIILQVT